MPMYCWLDKNTSTEVEILRGQKEYLDIPTLEESGLSELEYKEAEWEKLLQPFRMTRGAGWGGSKGNW